MAAKVKKPWARYDREFPNDDRVVSMPGRYRAAAYSLLLAMNGFAYSRGLQNPPATGRVTVFEVAALADKLGQKPQPLLRALTEAGIVQLEGREVLMPHFFDWNPELLEDAVTRRADAARAGAAARWQGRDAVEDAPRHATPHATPHAASNAAGDAVGDAISMPERDIDRRDTSPSAQSLTSPTPKPPLSDPMLGQFVVTVSEVLGRDLSPLEQQRLIGWWEEMPRIRPDLVKTQLGQYLEWRHDNLKPAERALKSLTPLYQQLRNLDARLADEGMPPRDRGGLVHRVGSMSSIGDVLRAVAQ